MMTDIGPAENIPLQQPFMPDKEKVALQTACGIVEIGSFLMVFVVLAKSTVPTWPVYLLWGAAAMFKGALWFDNTSHPLIKVLAAFNCLAGIGLFLIGIAGLMKL